MSFTLFNNDPFSNNNNSYSSGNDPFSSSNKTYLPLTNTTTITDYTAKLKDKVRSAVGGEIYMTRDPVTKKEIEYDRPDNLFKYTDEDYYRQGEMNNLGSEKVNKEVDDVNHQLKIIDDGYFSSGTIVWAIILAVIIYIVLK